MYKDILNRKCLVRSSEAGVYFGTVTKIDNQIVRMEKVRNLWHWEGASCLSQVAQEGIKSGEVSQTVPSMVINGCCQIIPLSPQAIENLESQEEWRERE